MTALQVEDARRRAADAGRQTLETLARLLWGVGWLVAQTLWLVLWLLGGTFYGVGWLGRKAVWPALKWCGAATAIGWQDAHKKPDRR